MKGNPMAFAIRNLSVLAYANGFTLWHYKAGSDDPKIVGGAGYFSDASDMLTAGDMVMVSAQEGGRMLCVVPGAGGLATAALA
jgi:hypothetical protein